MECEESEEPNGRDECVVCMTDTILFDGECFACPQATNARTAIVQEAEREEEEIKNWLRLTIGHKFTIILPTLEL